MTEKIEKLKNPLEIDFDSGIFTPLHHSFTAWAVYVQAYPDGYAVTRKIKSKKKQKQKKQKNKKSA